MTRLRADADDRRRMRSTNWIWALGAFVVWAGILFAFLLIAIARP